MSEEKIESETRLMMIENFLSILFTTMYRQQSFSPETIKELHSKLLEQTRRETFPGIDPSMSDHISAEYEKHVQRFLDSVEQKASAPKD